MQQNISSTQKVLLNCLYDRMIADLNSILLRHTSYCVGREDSDQAPFILARKKPGMTSSVQMYIQDGNGYPSFDVLLFALCQLEEVRKAIELGNTLTRQSPDNMLEDTITNWKRHNMFDAMPDHTDTSGSGSGNRSADNLNQRLADGIHTIDSDAVNWVADQPPT